MENYKDSIANATTIAGVGMTMADIQSIISVLVLFTALILNVTRIYTWFREKKQNRLEDK